MDLHTKSSHKNDHGGFDNDYTPLGNYLNKIKYHSKKQYISIVGTAASRFILGYTMREKMIGLERSWGISLSIGIKLRIIFYF